MSISRAAIVLLCILNCILLSLGVMQNIPGRAPNIPAQAPNIPGKIDWLKVDNLSGRTIKADEIIAKVVRIEDASANGNTCVVKIQAHPDGAIICTGTSQDANRKLVLTFSDGRPRLRLLDAKGTTRAMLLLTELDNPELLFFDADEKEVGRVPRK